MTQQPQQYPQQPPAGYTGYAEGPGAASAGPYNQQFPGQVSGQEFQQAYPQTNTAPGYPPVNEAGYPQQTAPNPPQGPGAQYSQQPQNQPASPFNQAGPAAAPPGGDAWGEPGSGLGGGDGPALHQLVDRLIFWRPRKNSITLGTKYQSQETEEQMVVDLIVLDGSPIPAHVNGDSGAQTPFAAGPKVAPFFVTGVRVNKVVLDKLREYHDSANPEATCLARLVKTPPRGQGKPYNDLKAATAADGEIARPVYPRWAELKAGATAQAPAQWGAPQGGQQPFQANPAPQYQPVHQPMVQQPPYPQQAPPAGYQQYQGQQ